MTETKIIDGKAFAEKLRGEIARKVAKLKTEKGITPGLAVIRVGDDPASEVYVRNKVKQTKEVGMNSFELRLPKEITEEELRAKVRELNDDKTVHGILVQLPLPEHIDGFIVIDTIDPHKDVDGFNIINVAGLAVGEDPYFIPCTPMGCLMLLKNYFQNPNNYPKDKVPGQKPLAGLHAIILGRSNIVGKPMIQLLLKEDCTVTIAHSKTANVSLLVKQADIVIAAVGRPEIVKGEWLKKGAVVIDVGINRIASPDGKTKLVGDVDFQSCLGIAAAITPVPGGVGPMTIACLLENTLRAAKCTVVC